MSILNPFSSKEKPAESFAVQCYGGPMDGALVPRNELKNGGITRGIVGAMRSLVNGHLFCKLFVNEWSETDGGVRVRYQLDANDKLRYVSSWAG